MLDRGAVEPKPSQRDPQWQDRRVSKPETSPRPQTADAEPVQDTARLIEWHESRAARSATLGEWRKAYDHLRLALDLLTAKGQPAHVPEQLRREVAQLRREHAEAREQSIRDTLTASYNRRYLDQRLVALVEQQRHSADGLAVALVDLDWFKNVNDTFGHLVGDQVLQRVVDLLQEGLPDSGFCARYGGEEFVLVLPGTDETTALAVAEMARARIEQYSWSTIALGLQVTVSIGVAHEPAFQDDRHNRSLGNPYAQLRRADRLLYAAKRSGRNAVAYEDAGQTWLTGPAAGRRAITRLAALAR
jgi:diguanylate cyclase (GGDEF)-like protein